MFVVILLLADFIYVKSGYICYLEFEILDVTLTLWALFETKLFKLRYKFDLFKLSFY